MYKLFHEPPISNHKSHKLLGRRGIQRLDLLFLVVESIDLNASQAISWNTEKLGLIDVFPNRVELWKQRCHNPLRRTPRRGALDQKTSTALITLLCSMAERVYPLLRQLLSTSEPDSLNSERWAMLQQRLKELVNERMNTRRATVQRILYGEDSNETIRELVVTLSLSVGLGGFERLQASLHDNVL